MDRMSKIMFICSFFVFFISISLILGVDKKIEQKIFHHTNIGNSCDDGNSETIRDVYVDEKGTCIGYKLIKRKFSL